MQIRLEDIKELRILYLDVVLRLISLSDLEMIRSWRNKDSVRNKLLSNEAISEEDQKAWYLSLDRQKEIHFIIEEKGIPVGLIYATNVNQNELSFEGNIFIGDTNSSDSRTVLKSVIMLSDFFFDKLGFKKAYSKVKNDNQNALSIDSALGFEIDREESNVLYCELSAANYFVNSIILKKRLFNGWDPSYLNFNSKTDHSVPI